MRKADTIPALLFALAQAGCDVGPPPAVKEEQLRANAQAAIAANKAYAAALRVRCRDNPAELLETARAAMRDNKPETALKALAECREELVDPSGLRLREEAERAVKKAEGIKAAQASAQLAKQAAAAKAQKRREGVAIGMSQQDVLDSNWGKPRKINRTTNTRGTDEQWVYDGGYLYFENGVLRTIQN